MKNLTKEWVSKAEKYMKALLQENNIFFEKIHDLDILLEKCKTFILELSNMKQELLELSSFAVEIRYPGTEEATSEEAEKSLSIAETVRKIIRTYLKLSIEE